ncbi:NineTeen Complex (NTC) component [Umbelopsis nana]
MARNEEKAQSMLYRFREAQAAELGLSRPQKKRPAIASEVRSLPESEKWRRQVLSEISRKVSKIQDAGLSDYQVRDLNDEINKLMREKLAWEHRIKELGGPDYLKIGPKLMDQEGKEVPGNRGYKYFGRAKDLPGVRELFEQEAPEPAKKTRQDLYRNVDADYYGYRDEEDGEILEYEAEREKELIELLKDASYQPSDLPDEMDVDGSETNEESSIHVAISETLAKGAAVPTQQEIEQILVQRRRQQLLDRYVSQDIEENERETKQLTGMA